MNSPEARALAPEIARCGEVPLARADGSHACSTIVNLQSDDPLSYQVPEAWAGNLERARIVFVSSNPSISEKGPDPGSKSPEDYPREAWTDASIVDFMTRRFDPETSYTDGDRVVCQDGTLSVPVKFWAAIRRRATELLGYPADPSRDYVMTEIVHCKSKGEQGVPAAASHCAGRYFERVLALTAAPVIVLIGSKARARAGDVLHLDPSFGTKAAIGDEYANIAVRHVGGRDRVVVCYLWHPAAWVQASRKFPGSFPTLHPMLREIALDQRPAHELASHLVDHLAH